MSDERLDEEAMDQGRDAAAGKGKARTSKKATTKKGKTKRTKKGAEQPDQVLMPRVDVQLLERLRAKALEADELALKEAKAKQTHKACKDLLDEARSELQQMLRATTESTPLLDRAEPDGWKRVPLQDAVGTDHAKLLRENSSGIIGATLGSLTAFLEDHRLTDVKGVGRATADKIEDRLGEFWRRNPQWTGAAEEKTDGKEGAKK